MDCRFCGEMISSWNKTCPKCGKQLINNSKWWAPVGGNQMAEYDGEGRLKKLDNSKE